MSGVVCGRWLTGARSLQFEAHQPDQRGDEAFGLPKREVVHLAQGQCHQDRQIRVPPLPTGEPGGGRIPRADRALVEPDGEVTTASQRLAVGSPVQHAVLRLYPVQTDFGVTLLFVLAAISCPLVCGWECSFLRASPRCQTEPYTNAVGRCYGIFPDCRGITDEHLGAPPVLNARKSSRRAS